MPPVSQGGVPVNKLVPFLGFIFGFGLACSRSIQGEDADYQRRIDKFCSYACTMGAECGLIDAYDGCFDECSTGEYWWEGDDDCRDSRWEYYDCRAKVTTCDVWGVGSGEGHDCDAAFNQLASDCVSVANKD
jgi:hypothetical protein